MNAGTAGQAISGIVRPVMLDDITQAVLAREEVARYLRGGHGQSELEARERIHAYLDELRTTQRYPIYRALKHPLYPILRKIERIDEARPTSRSRRHAHGRVDLHLEPQEPSRLPRRAAGARRQRHPPAGHRRGHQPVRRPARPAPPSRHRRHSDPAQHEGPGLPGHAEGLRRRAAAAARSAVLHRGRAQLLGRAEGAEDRAAARGDAGASADDA